MFDLAWSEIAVIAVVAVVVIGPKDLPEAIRGVAKGVQKLRRMAGDFQQQADELVREAKLDDVRNSIHEMKSTINEIRSFDIKGEIQKAVDADGTLQQTMAEDPLRDTFMPPPPAPYVPPCRLRRMPPPLCRPRLRVSPPPCRRHLNQPRRLRLRHPPRLPPAFEDFLCPPPGMTIR
jgi:sec-independent protein translocase protein TatB